MATSNEPLGRRRQLASIFLLLAALAGYAASLAGYLEYRGSIGVCEGLPSPGAAIDCSRVYSLPQAEIAGIHLSEAAVPYFAALSLATIAYYSTNSRKALTLTAALALAGTLTIPYLVYLELFVAEAVCAWCTVMHIAIITCTLLAYSCLRQYS